MSIRYRAPRVAKRRPIKRLLMDDDEWVCKMLVALRNAPQHHTKGSSLFPPFARDMMYDWLRTHDARPNAVVLRKFQSDLAARGVCVTLQQVRNFFGNARRNDRRHLWAGQVKKR